MAPAAGDEVLRTVRIALSHIDQHRDRYDTTKKQDSMLEQLIDRHSLEYVPKKSVEKKRLTINCYRSRLQRAVMDDGIEGQGIHDLFLKGTLALHRDHRAEYAMNEGSVIGDTEDEGSGSAPDRAPDRPETVYIDVPRPAKKVSTVSTSTFKTPGEEGKPLPSPTWSPLTPANATVTEARKRKRLDEEDTEYVPSEEEAEHVPSKKNRPAIDVGVKPTVASSSGNVAVSAPSEKPEEKPSTQHGQEQVSKRSPTKNGPAKGFDTTRGLLKLSDDAIHNELKAIWTNIQSFTCGFFEGLGITPDDQAELVTEPHPELEKVYKKIFGEDWLKRALSLLTAGVINARRLVDACAAAAVHLMVFMEPLPWDGPEELMSSLAGESAGIDRVLVESSSNRHLRLHAVVWKAAANKVLDRDFQKATIRPHAEKLARRFLALMKTQQGYLGRRTMSEGWWEKRVNNLTAIFTRALVLKGGLRSAPDYYEVKWPKSGAAVNRNRMEELHPGPGEQEIVWGLSQLVHKRANTDEEWQMVRPGLVLSRPAAE